METQQERIHRLWTWFKVFDASKHDPKFRGFPEVKVTKELLDNIFAQIQAIVGQRKILFLAGDRDKDLWYSLFPKRVKFKNLQKSNPDENWHDFWNKYGVDGTGDDYNDHIIGTLTAVDRNPVGYTDPIDGVYVQIEVDEQFKPLPFRAYELHVGLDDTFTKFKPHKEPISYNEKFEIESCKVKGLYFKEFDNFNHVNGPTLSNYYGLRTLGMYIYLPGRAYY